VYLTINFNGTCIPIQAARIQNSPSRTGRDEKKKTRRRRRRRRRRREESCRLSGRSASSFVCRPREQTGGGSLVYRERCLSRTSISLFVSLSFLPPALNHLFDSFSENTSRRDRCTARKNESDQAIRATSEFHVLRPPPPPSPSRRILAPKLCPHKPAPGHTQQFWCASPSRICCRPLRSMNTRCVVWFSLSLSLSEVRLSGLNFLD